MRLRHRLNLGIDDTRLAVLMAASLSAIWLSAYGRETQLPYFGAYDHDSCLHVISLTRFLKMYKFVSIILSWFQWAFCACAKLGALIIWRQCAFCICELQCALETPHDQISVREQVEVGDLFFA